MEFALMFFAASEDASIKDKYNLVIESARFADRNGFSSVWVPERHFIKFGYLYPNPAILQSALARETKHIRLMAGSVVAPLHDPISVTEDWAMVDNLSGGRVGMSFAPGWNPDDFVFYPEKYKERHKEMYASVEVVKKLWEGGSINKLSGNGKDTAISIYPKPIQKKLPLWITAAGNPESFIKAGELGANLLTHILDQEAQQLGEKIALYRESLSKNGYDPSSRKVTVMIHTFLGADAEEIKEQARKPYCDYMKANKNIFAGLAQSRGNKVNVASMSDSDLDDLVNFLYDRFASTRGFIGAPENCFELLDALTKAGVDEVACLLDFGPHPDEILKNLPFIKVLKQKYNSEEEAPNDSEHFSENVNMLSRQPVATPIKIAEKLDAIRERCREVVSGQQLYPHLKEVLGLTGNYETIAQVSIGVNEAIGKVEIPKEIFELKDFSVHHPIVLDSCFQVFISSLPRTFSPSGLSYFPTGFKSMNVYSHATKQLSIHAVAKEIRNDHVAGDVYVFDEKENLVAKITSLQFQKTGGQEESIKTSVPSVAADRPASSMTTNKQRYETILSELSVMVGDLLQLDHASLDIHTSFIEMGSDSLILAAVMNKIDKKYGIRISIRQLFEDLNTLSLIAAFIDQRLPRTTETASDNNPIVEQTERAIQSPVSLDSPLNQASASVSSTGQTFLEQIIKQQLDIMSQQIQALSAQGQTGSLAETPSSSCSLKDAQKFTKAKASTPVLKKASSTPSQPIIFPKKDFNRKEIKGFTEEQSAYVNNFIHEFTTKTAQSKQLTQTYRHVLADNRASVGFRFTTKEMLYPIIGKSSNGSKIWDVDGNEYVDVAMGFGVNLFGHRPSFVTTAIEEQLQKGFQLGPQSDAAGEVASIVAELTNMDRVSFHNSGTEAVMTALRLARTVTGKNKTVIFAGSYHGHFDGTLVVGEDMNENPQAMPMSLGITQSMVDDIIVLEYGNFQSLEIIKNNAYDIAAVLVEPVQSRKPDLQPKEFLIALRELTVQREIALIFDEMITGFRIHPGGAQAWFGISADIATYGKIVGGGLPIGIIAGKAAFMDALDGGMWHFGDDSFPQVETTFFAGTFCKHPLAIASARAVLNEIKKQGPQLQEALNTKTTYLAQSLNTFFKEYDLNIHVGHFGSLFYFSYTGDMDLFFYHLVHKGIYVWEGKTCFLSTAHSNEDVEFIIKAIKDTLIVLLERGFIKSKSGVLPKIPSPSLAQHPSRQSSKERIPLTVSQRKIWISAQLEEGGSINNIPVVLQLKGDLDIEKLEQTLQVIVNRHEALRTVFDEEGNYQVVLDEVKFNLNVVQHLDIDPQDINTILKEWQIKNINESFDLTKGPLFKTELLQLRSSQYYLTFITHHIIADGWSTGIIIDEIGKIYTSLKTGAEIELESPSQFKEYIHSLAALSQTPVMYKQEQFWLSKFSILPPTLENLPDHSAPLVKSFKGSRKILMLDAAKLQGLTKLGLELKASKHMILMASYFAMFHRLTGEKDVVVSMPMASRLSNNFYYMVGCCANMMPIRSTIQSDVSFLDLLSQTKTELILAYENQDFSYGSLIDKLDAPRDLINNPLMELGFNFNPNVKHPELFKLETQIVHALASYSENGLIFHLNEMDGGLLIECDFSTDLYNDSRIESFLETYSLILQAIIDNPTVSLSQLPIITETEKSKISNEWNDTGFEYPAVTLHTLFEEQTKQSPEKIAIEFGANTITFHELNKKANQLAHHLRKTYAVKPDDLIGIMLDRSEWMMISILAILKSGAAYVPIDPDYPEARINYILDDASVKALIIDSEDARKNISLDSVSVVSLKEDWEKISKSSTKNPALNNSNSNLAYVIYTSGSTGSPKGVMIEHSGVVNRINWMWRHYNFASEDVIFQKTTYAFDVSVWEIFMPLCFGAKMVLCKKEVIYDPEQILKHIYDYGITTLHFVPSMLSLFLENITEENKYMLSSLRHVMASGEALPVQTVRSFYRKLTVPLHNLYGPTEASVDVSYHQTNDTSKIIPIGKPIDNIQLYIVDDQLDLRPVGSVGEIAIAGIGLSRGYIGLPSLTEEKFRISDHIPGQRLYLTGDLGRWLPNGEIAYLGRKDHQVKINGNRIELGEIENVLGSYDGILLSVAMVLENSGVKELVAYFTTEKEFNELNARVYLGTKLPSYMIPSRLIQVDSIPLTPNGKVDRKSLSKLVITGSERKVSPPKNEMERKLLKIWKTILNRDEIDVTDNFFALGGQSLKAIQMISSIHKEIGKKIDLRSVFIYPTISLLGSYLEKSSSENYEKIMPTSRRSSYNLSERQKPMWLLAQVEKDFKPYNMFKEFLIEGKFDKEVFERTIEFIVSRHESLRTSFDMVDGTPKQFIHLDKEFQFKIKYVDGSDPETRREVLTHFASELGELVFDLTEPPLFRFCVIQLDSHTHIVSLAIHHIISDAWSNDILAREVTSIYQSLLLQQAVNLNALEIQYKDYSEWEQRLLNSEEITIHKTYWHQKLDGKLPVLNLPLDMPRGKKAYNGVVYHITMDKNISKKLRDFNRKYNSTSFITLLSALNVLLYKYTGQQDIIVGTPVAGRSLKELEDIVGLFINSLPLRNIIDGNASFADFLNLNKTNVLEAHQHEIYPYVKLVEDLNLEYDLHRNPLFDVLIVMVENDDIFEKVQALSEVKDLRQTHNTSKLDLAFYIAEKGDEIDLGIEFRPELFLEETIKKMATDFIALVEIFLANPLIQIDELKGALLSPLKKAEHSEFENKASSVLSDDF